MDAMAASAGCSSQESAIVTKDKRSAADVHCQLGTSHLEGCEAFYEGEDQSGAKVSKHDLDRTLSSVSTLIGSYAAEVDAALPEDSWVTQHLHQLESKMEVLLHTMSEEIAEEVGREREHLLLMQSQMDKHGQILTHQMAELHKKMERESAKQSFVSSSVRESKEVLVEHIERQAQEIELLKSRLTGLEEPGFNWLAKACLHYFWRCCFWGRSYPLQPRRLAAAQQPLSHGASPAPKAIKADPRE